MPFFLSRNKKETATWEAHRAALDVVQILGFRCPLLDPFSRQSSGLTNCIEKRNKKWTSGGHPTIRDIYTTSMCRKKKLFYKHNLFTNWHQFFLQPVRTSNEKDPNLSGKHFVNWPSSNRAAVRGQQRKFGLLALERADGKGRGLFKVTGRTAEWCISPPPITIYYIPAIRPKGQIHLWHSALPAANQQVLDKGV